METSAEADKSCDPFRFGPIYLQGAFACRLPRNFHDDISDEAEKERNRDPGIQGRQSPLLTRFRRSAMHLVCVEGVYGNPVNYNYKRHYTRSGL